MYTLNTVVDSPTQLVSVLIFICWTITFRRNFHWMSTRRSGPGLPADFAFPAETPDSRRGALVTLAPRTYATATASVVAPVSVSAATARAPPASIL